MTKKKERPKQTLSPMEITNEEFSDAMRRLIKNNDFKVLTTRLINLRYDILEAGKKLRAEGKRDMAAEQFAVLEGFDAAAMEPIKWANMRTRRRRQTESPTQDLEG